MTNWDKSKELLNNFDILTLDIPNEIFNWLKDYSYKVKSNNRFHNSKMWLMSDNESWKIPKDVTKFFESNITNLKSVDKIDYLTKDCPIVLDSLWVNFQKKHEFSPLHDHKGIASFIVFVNIPYDLEKEQEHFCNTNPTMKNYTSRLCFTNFLGDGSFNINPIPVDKSFEGKMIMFSANQLHEVYPFYTSDDFRVTISGNFRYKV